MRGALVVARLATTAAALAATACVPPPPAPYIPPPSSIFDPPPPHTPPPGYNTRITELRTTLGRAGIHLEVRGVTEFLRTAACTEDAATREQAGCARCELAGETEPLDGAALAAIKHAFDGYSTAFLAASKIEHVALCRTLTEVNGEQTESPAGTVDVHARRLLISVAPFLDHGYDPRGALTVDEIVHHELFHQLEFDVMHDLFIDDPAWDALNPPSFTYGVHGPDRPAGFVNVYAATAEHEDRASVYQYLLARPDELCTIAHDDPIVRAKVNLLCARLSALPGAPAICRAGSPDRCAS